jgi:enoyl-CoA hydratase/carnithine racemase
MSADYQFIRYETPAPHVVSVILDRPEVANALHHGLMEELEHAVRRLDRDPDVRVWLLSGRPRPDGRPCFSGGADLKAAAAGAPRPRGDRVTDLIDDLLTPSIAVVDGVCTTGALELALACDLRFAADTAAFSDLHMQRFGLGMGGWGGAVRLSRLVGPDKAKELLLLSPVIDGHEAARIGLANRVAPSGTLMDVALAAATRIAGTHASGLRTTMGFFAMQADMSKRDALHWAELARRMPGFAGRPSAEVGAEWDGATADRDRPAAGA